MNISVCKECQDRLPMVNVISGESSQRCYGYINGYELKKDICIGDNLPETNPEWCPKLRKEVK